MNRFELFVREVVVFVTALIGFIALAVLILTAYQIIADRRLDLFKPMEISGVILCAAWGITAVALPPIIRRSLGPRVVVVLLAGSIGFIAIATLIVAAYETIEGERFDLFIPATIAAVILCAAWGMTAAALRPVIRRRPGRRAFNWFISLAAATSILFCLAADIGFRHKVNEEQLFVASRRAELQRLANIDREVQAYQKQKWVLQDQLDLINQLKQNARHPMLVIGQATNDAAIDNLAQQLRAQKQTQRDHSFTLRVVQ